MGICQATVQHENIQTLRSNWKAIKGSKATLQKRINNINACKLLCIDNEKKILYWPPATADHCGYNTSNSLNYIATWQENFDHLQGSNLYKNEISLLGQFNDIDWTVEKGFR